MDKVVLIPQDASKETVIHQVNELSRAVRFNEINIGKLTTYNSKKEIDQIKALHAVSDDLKNYFSTSLNDSMEKHNSEVIDLISSIRKEVDEMNDKYQNVEKRLETLETKDKDDIYNKWQWLKNAVAKGFEGVIGKVVVGVLLWLAAILTYGIVFK